MLVKSGIYRKSKTQAATLLALGALLFLVLLLSLSVGAFPIPVYQVLSVIMSNIGIELGDFTTQQRSVLVNIRLPRVILAMLVGGGLGLSGAALQGLFRNPLVEPGLIGVSSGGALFAVVYIVFGASIPLLQGLSGIGLPLFAFMGGLLNTFLVYRLASSSGKTDISLLILAGVALNALSGALIGLAIFYADDAAMRNFTFWSLGDVGGANWQKVYTAFLLIIGPAVLVFTQFRQLNALALGESEAFHMGVNVQKVKYILLISSAMMVGTAVSLTGTIGFVGLIVPHLIRLGFGADHRLVLPASFLLGAILLSVADVLARTLVVPAELPIGIITAIIGAPFFIWLIINFKKLRN
ncbi:FecCD family ABC transporter permease [Arthrospiribacter ruber]|uniref:Iron ABC transporter permease n=1 Tax=Arthrospiribacter ruber TaxID=2487934 RepID=A0A951MDD1_9BACT|nr:iron ABC transporter permease [Arthrospiribacter ruber]MBW3468417.1 iron ABC transporter permease [Arthrospiribacter ruber]